MKVIVEIPNDALSNHSACPFCHIEQSRIINDRQSVFAFRDKFPVSLGHTLIVPRRHVADITFMDDLESLESFQLMQSIMAELKKDDASITAMWWIQLEELGALFPKSGDIELIILPTPCRRLKTSASQLARLQTVLIIMRHAQPTERRRRAPFTKHIDIGCCRSPTTHCVRLGMTSIRGLSIEHYSSTIK